jgi:hypothetical protein
MPLSIPAFDQYQSPMFPLRGLWNTKPVEGDKFVNAEIDWLVTTKATAVQFSLSGNSPVSLSQIVALCVDNSRSGADVDFVFPDSGFVLTVPAHNQLVAPVFTNALMFYASAPSSIAGDVTVFQILNSMPPPIPIAPSTTQNHAGINAIPTTNGSTVLVAAGINGTLNTLSITLAANAAGGALAMSVIDGSGKSLWVTYVSVPASSSQINFPFNVPGLDVRFVNGLNLVVSGSTLAGVQIIANVYYSTP